MIIYTLIMKKAYKLLHYGDPLLKTPSHSVAFPLSDAVDSTIDDCINTLVSLGPIEMLAQRGGLLAQEIDISGSALGRSEPEALRDVRQNLLVSPEADVHSLPDHHQPRDRLAFC